MPIADDALLGHAIVTCQLDGAIPNCLQDHLYCATCEQSMASSANIDTKFRVTIGDSESESFAAAETHAPDAAPRPGPIFGRYA